MRLIDGDALIDKLPVCEEDKQISLFGAVADMVVMISDMPEITPESLIERGKWYLNEDGKWACSVCDGLAIEHPDEPDK